MLRYQGTTLILSSSRLMANRIYLTRVSTLRGLKLIDYDIKCIKADPKVLAWYKKFERGRSTPAQHNKDVSQKHAAHTAQNISILTNNDDDDSSDDSSSYEQSPKFASRRPQSTRYDVAPQTTSTTNPFASFVRYYAASSSEQTAREKLERERKRLEGVRPTCVNNSVILPRTGIQVQLVGCSSSSKLNLSLTLLK